MFEFVDQDMTMSLWIYGDAIQPEEEWGVLFEGWCPTWSMEAYAPDPSGDVMWWTSEGVLYWKESTSTDWKGQWNHYAFVSDSAAEKLTLYCNGEIVEQTDGYLDRISDLQTGFFTLGAWYEGMWGVYQGKMDEFRIYNYALSQDEILTLAHQSEVYQPLLYPEVDLAEDGKINILDFAVLASRWLERELWP